MQLTRRQDFGSPLLRLRDRLNQFFDVPTWDQDFFEGWMPAVDIREDKDKLTVKAELPGMKKEDINVSLHENNLILSGERRCEETQKEGEFYRSECYYGKFQRSILLPTSVDSSKIDASYNDGILRVTLPKSEQAKRKQIQVKG